MNKRSTHNKLTKGLLPWVDMKVIDRVNKALDGRKGAGAILSSAAKTLAKQYPFVNMGVKKTGHRSVNHDLLSAVVTGYEAGTMTVPYALWPISLRMP